MTTEANADDFAAEMDSNPCGRRVGLRAVGPYVLERYDDLITARRRRKNGDELQERIGVWVKDPDHWRTYRKVGSFRAVAANIAKMWDRLDDTDAVAEWVEEYPSDI